ncbi:hypothetical protein AAC387_Pa02g2594 [Persea americana]
MAKSRPVKVKTYAKYWKRRSCGRRKIPGCITCSSKPRKFKKKVGQDTTLAPLEENTFYPLTQKEGRRYRRWRLASVTAGPTLCPPKVHTKLPKKRQQHFPINNVAEFAQFENLLKKKEKNEVDMLTLPVHHPEEVDPIIDCSVSMVAWRNAKKKNNDQRRITQQWVVKKDDLDITIVCMTEARRGGTLLDSRPKVQTPSKLRNQIKPLKAMKLLS